MNERELNQSLLKKEIRLTNLPSHIGDVRVTLAYPNRYWVAMSNLGFQTVFKLFSTHERLRTERAFLPEKEASEIRTFETNQPLTESDIVALSVSFETDYPSVLSVLAAAGINLESRRESLRSGLLPADVVGLEDERPARPFILGGGAALTLNPEVLANFFDAIVVGEGEEVLPRLIDRFLRYHDSADELFSQFLRDVAQIDGVYVPAFYRPSYKSDGTMLAIDVAANIPEHPVRQYVKDISKYPTTTVIQTAETEFRSMFMTETGRGCEIGCRFCVAGYMYRPVRKRDEESLRATVQLGIESGESVGFVGAAVSSHPKIAALASQVAREGKRASLSSIMSQRVTPELASSLSESEYKTVALAPEAGSEELRFRVGKRVCDSQILSGIETLAENGIRNFKLYFIVGLPSETDEDVHAISRLVAEAQRVALAAARRQEVFRVAPTLLLSVNPFIPKAWTPFQRHGSLPFKEVKRRLELVRSGVRRLPNVEMKNESPRESYFQAVMSRGDRRVGDLLLELRAGGRDWRHLVQHSSVALLSDVPPADFYVHRTMDPDELLPWEVVDLQLKRSLLEREYNKTFTEDVRPLIARAKIELEALNPREVVAVEGGEIVCQ